MKKQVQKIVVPPREERLEQIGDPKAPKMGGITPKKIQVPEVDDLLDKLKKATKPMFITWDIGVEDRSHSHCHVNCKCPPCLGGFCSLCTVEALRNEPQDVVRAAVTQYRGVVFQ